MKHAFLFFNLIALSLLSCRDEDVSNLGSNESWGATKLYGHAFANADFTNEEYSFIAKNFPLFAIEKRHAQRVYGKASTEKATIATAKKLKKRNPETEVLLYWNCDLIYSGLYETKKNLHVEHPEWVRKSRFPIAAAPYSYNFAEQGARDFWVDTASEIINTPSIDGVFIDASSKAALNNQLEIVEELMDKLPGLVIYNGFRYNPRTKGFYGGLPTLEHADGVFVEAFMSASVTNAERAEALLDELLKIPKDKLLICNGLQDGFGSKGSHQFSFAAHLIVANAKTYYRYGVGHAFHTELMTYWHEDFGKETGKPLGKATKEGRIYRRAFENVDVTLDLDNEQVTLDWK